MKKTISYLGLLAVSFANAQQQVDEYLYRMGINTRQPQATLDVRESPIDSNDKRLQGLSLPNFTTDQRNKLGEGQTQSMKVGTLIYNTTKKCVEMYKGYSNGNHQWECLYKKNNTNAQQGVSLQPIGFEGSYITGNAFNNTNKVKFLLNNNGTSPLTNINLSNAVQVQNAGGNITVAPNQNTSVNVGAGQNIALQYLLQGTPAQGNLTATMSYSGATATVTQQVITPTSVQGNVPNGVTLLGNSHYISSVKDNEYLPYTPSTQPATWDSGQIDGDDPMIDVQGIITTQGIEVIIPYKTVGGVTGNIGAYRQEVNVPATMSKNNTAGTLILEWEETPVNSSGGFIRATLKAKNTDFYIKQLDLEKGLGNNQQGVVLANFSYKSGNNNSITGVFTVRVMSGIPDRKFGVQTYMAPQDRHEYLHQFLYLPVLGNDGKWWLNNNLGADYAKVGDTYFNPNHQAGARDTNGNLATNVSGNHTQYDYRAYGSLFQWGRRADGHELIDWNGGHNNWNNGQQPRRVLDYLHQYLNSADLAIFNEACPDGWHTPTQDEYQLLMDYTYAAAVLEQPPLRFAPAGFYNGNFERPTHTLYYWTSTPNDDYAHFLYGRNQILRLQEEDKRHMMPIRCIKGNPVNVPVPPNTGNTTVLPPGVTLKNYTLYIGSVKDNSYLPYTPSTQPATWEAGQTNGNDPMINVQGKIPYIKRIRASIPIEIPITVVGNGGRINAHSQKIDVPAYMSEDNKPGKLVLYWDSEDVTANTKFLRAYLAAENEEFNIKQLDLEKGLGNDQQGVELGKFVYNSDNLGNTASVSIRVISGIPDKKFGVQTTIDGQNEYRHQFLYVPIQGPDGNFWLNNNLGAGYSNTKSSYFNHNYRAGYLYVSDSTVDNFPFLLQIIEDRKAYGSLFQWGREADGHEQMDFETEIKIKYPSLGWNPTDNFVENCPSGWKTPEISEVAVLEYSSAPSRRRCYGCGFYSGKDIGEYPELYDLRFTNMPIRQDNRIGRDISIYEGYYWSRHNSEPYMYAIRVGLFNHVQRMNYNYALGIRCIKE